MTGYGKAEAVLAGGKLTIEIRTLNGKNADISIKSSILPKDKDILVRQKIASALVRGTIDVFVSFEANVEDSARHINAEMVAEYYRQILAVRKAVGGEETDLFRTMTLNEILHFPEVIEAKRQEMINEDNWSVVEKAFDEAIEGVNNFRAREGAALYQDVTSRVANILELENEVERLEPERMDIVKAKLLKALDDLAQKPDQNRFEQEMIFYLEKYDINEEKVRLRQHCKYFMDTIDGEEYPGKKLGFIIQEMGREINTTGSKANHAGIQKAVVRMKDELEKIREQSMNIL